MTSPRLAQGDEVSTHQMLSFDKYAAPTIVEIGGKLVKLDADQAIEYALKTGEFIEFDNEEDAIKFAENGYKQVPIIKVDKIKMKGLETKPARIISRQSGGDLTEEIQKTPNFEVDTEVVKDKISIVEQLNAIQANSKTIGFDPLQAAEMMSIANKLVSRAKSKYPEDKRLIAVLDQRIDFLGNQLMTQPIQAGKILKNGADLHESLNYDESKSTRIQDEYYNNLKAVLARHNNRFKINPGQMNPALVQHLLSTGQLKFKNGGILKYQN